MRGMLQETLTPISSIIKGMFSIELPFLFGVLSIIVLPTVSQRILVSMALTIWGNKASSEKGWTFVMSINNFCSLNLHLFIFFFNKLNYVPLWICLNGIRSKLNSHNPFHFLATWLSQGGWNSFLQLQNELQMEYEHVLTKDESIYA